MSEIRTQPVVATLVDDIDEVKATPGAFEFYVSSSSDGKPVGMIYSCPCGCGGIRALDFKPRSSPSWQWDGNRDAPTLTPSVHWVGHWHGFLRNGVWESC